MELVRWVRESSLAPLRSVKAMSFTDGAWRETWDDLIPLCRMIGDASLVGLSEAAHGGAEPLEFRNRLFQYLVCEQGFTAIALESGLAESRILQEYVHGGTGELTSALKKGITWGFGELPQNAALIRWMREYNATAAAARKINFYGFDVSAAQADGMLKRRVPAGVQMQMPTPGVYEISTEHSAALDERDRAQADHIERIVEREGPSGRILLFASRYHLSATPVTMSYSPQHRETRQRPAGIRLRQRYGDKLVTLCNLTGGGEVASGGYRENLGRAPAESVDGIAAQLGEPMFALDLRAAPAVVAQELRQECQLSAGRQILKLPLADAFDILLYIDRVTPACV